MIPKRVLGGAYVKEGSNFLPTSDDLDDRIINLKFMRRGKRGFTIRSDYEPVFHKDGSITFKRCVEKPDIEISYKQVAESVAIEVDIKITNFTVGDTEKESSRSMDSYGGDPITECVIQMGYRSQFPDWTLNGSRSGNIDQYYDLNNHAISDKPDTEHPRQIKVQILTGYATSYPPDKVTYFKGIIGNTERGLIWNHSVEDLLMEKYGDPSAPDGSEIEEVLFQNITKRYVRSSIPHAIEDDEFKVFVNDKWESLDLVNGIMSSADALEYGARCFISKSLKRVEAHRIYTAGAEDLSGEELEKSKAEAHIRFYGAQNTVGSQLVELQQHYSFLRWYLLADGNFYLYHKNDAEKDVWSDPFIKEQRRNGALLLPAIYDMTAMGTRTIRCPFISFLSPMMTVLFESRFSIGSLISFFYPIQTNAFLVITNTTEFATVQDKNTMELMCVDLARMKIDTMTGKVLTSAEAKVEAVSAAAPVPSPSSSSNILAEALAKAGDETKTALEQSLQQRLTPEPEPLSEPELILTPEEEIEIAEAAEEDIVPEEAVIPPPADMRWEKIIIPVVLKMSWERIVNDKMVVAPERWPEGELPGEKEKLIALKKWNPEFFDPDGPIMKRTDGNKAPSTENQKGKLVDRAGVNFRVPWLRPGDKIVIYQPFQPEYPEDQGEE